MIGIIGYQDDVIGFGLTGITHLQELAPNASKEDVHKAQTELENQGVDVLLIPAALREHLQETDIMIIEIPQEDDTNIQEIERLTKELLGVEL